MIFALVSRGVPPPHPASNREQTAESIGLRFWSKRVVVGSDQAAGVKGV
jgi:hypothetical protein